MTIPAVSGTAVRRWLPVAWCLALVTLLLGPALAPGFVLTYDMVWVPDLSLRPDFFGLSTAVPRAVPSDTAVAVLDNVVGGEWLAKLVLVGSLVGAGLGFRRLVGPGLVAQLVAVSFAVWNPFVVERLWMGHWTVLVAYGTLPWVVRSGLGLRAGLSGTRWPLLAVLVGSLSHSAGIITGLALLVTGWRNPRQVGALRHDLRLLALLAAANAPWLVAGWVHRAGAVSAEGSDVFAASGSGSMPGPLAWLPLAGIWNSAVVPQSWLGVSAWIGLLLVVGLSVAGARSWWREPATGPGSGRPLLVLWALGYLIALLGQVPGAIDLLGAVPGGGAIRDGSRMLALCAPLVVCLMARGAERVRAGARQPLTRAGWAALVVLGPLVVLPDAVWGGQGRLSAVAYPASWAQVREVVTPGHGDALVLPFTSYRAPAWNGHRPVLDPMGRALRVPTVTSDVLLVRGLELPGGDPRVRSVELALAAADPQARADALNAVGIGWIVLDRTGAPSLLEQVPEVAGTVLWEDADVRVVRLEGSPVQTELGSIARVQLVTAWLLWGTVLCTGGLLLVFSLARMGRRSRGNLEEAR